MKKVLVLMMGAVMLLALAACGSEKQEESNGITDSLELLNTVWESWPEDAVFPAGGGDSEQYVMEGPGKFSVEDPEILDGALAFPAAEADKIDDAASLTHMMNANTFTGGAFRMKDPKDMEAVAGAVKENLDGRQWLCGFPQEYVIASVDQYLVYAFGTTENVAAFKSQLNGAYKNVNVLSEGPVSAG